MSFDIRRAIDAANASIGIAVPKSILKPTSGPCEICQHDTDEWIDETWCHQDCHDAAVDEQRADDRYNDPRRGQAAALNRGR